LEKIFSKLFFQTNIFYKVVTTKTKMARTKMTARGYAITPSQLHSPLPTYNPTTTNVTQPTITAAAAARAAMPTPVSYWEGALSAQSTQSAQSTKRTRYRDDSDSTYNSPSESESDSESDPELVPEPKKKLRKTSE
jgi:hypothetical protein